jgi:hypothetical protein
LTFLAKTQFFVEISTFLGTEVSETLIFRSKMWRAMPLFAKVLYEYKAASLSDIVTIKVEIVISDPDTFLNEFSTASGLL